MSRTRRMFTARQKAEIFRQQLEEKLKDRNEVIAELMEANVKAKKL